MATKTLTDAKKNKNDEFYTQSADIEKELAHYKEHFAGKTVLCNCDDPRVSNFFKFFALKFDEFKLKRLITTCYKNQDVDLFSQNNCEKAVWIDYRGNPADKTNTDFSTIEVKNLDGDGDFRSAECVELLKQADIVVTNPPFSLFREYVAQLVEYDKKFIIIGNKNAITYKEIFPLIKENKLWTGYRGFSGGMWFVSDYEGKTEKVIDGQKLINVPSIWFTNLDIKKRHEELVLYKHYTPEEYPKYDNYDAINVDKVSDIPCDYFPSENCSGNMGVPITFLDKYNPEQFEIVKFRKGNDGKDLTYTIPADTISADSSGRLRLTSESSSGGRCNGIMGVPITFLDKYNPEQFELIGATESEGKGFSSGLWDSTSGIAQPVVRGERKYKRLFIRRKV